MTVAQPTEYNERWEPVPPFQMHIISYKFGDIYYCSVDDVDPGAVISRSHGSTRIQAEQQAVKRAKERLEYSRSRYNAG